MARKIIKRCSKYEHEYYNGDCQCITCTKNTSTIGRACDCKCDEYSMCHYDTMFNTNRGFDHTRMTVAVVNCHRYKKDWVKVLKYGK